MSFTNNTEDYLYDGTQLVQTATGQGSIVRLRKIYVRKSTDSPLDGPNLIAAAKEEYIRTEPAYAPGIPDLPLARITGRQISINLVELIAEYSGVNSIVGEGTTLVKFNTTLQPTKIWSAVSIGENNGSGEYFQRGMPWGKLLGGGDIDFRYDQKEKDAALSTIHNRKCVLIRVQRTSFGVNPLSFFFDKINTTGGGKIAGFTCDNGTLLLKGLSSNATTPGTLDPTGQTPSGQLIFDYNLDLVYDPFGFPVQYWQRTLEGNPPPPEEPGEGLARRSGGVYGRSGFNLGDDDSGDGNEDGPGNTDPKQKYFYQLAIGPEYENKGWQL